MSHATESEEAYFLYSKKTGSEKDQQQRRPGSIEYIDKL